MLLQENYLCCLYHIQSTLIFLKHNAQVSEYGHFSPVLIICLTKKHLLSHATF